MHFLSFLDVFALLKPNLKRKKKKQLDRDFKVITETETEKTARNKQI